MTAAPPPDRYRYLEWPDADGADALRARSDDHRHGYLHGWRDVMGFAYLTLTPAP